LIAVRDLHHIDGRALGVGIDPALTHQRDVAQHAQRLRVVVVRQPVRAQHDVPVGRPDEGLQRVPVRVRVERDVVRRLHRPDARDLSVLVDLDGVLGVEPLGRSERARLQLLDVDSRRRGRLALGRRRRGRSEARRGRERSEEDRAASQVRAAHQLRDSAANAAPHDAQATIT
jgi:hypothetical protein